MESLISNLIVVLLVCFSAKQVSALRCYDCHNLPSGGNDVSTCKKLAPSMIKTCPESDAINKYVCRTFTFKSKDRKITFEKRSCGKLEYENILEYDGADHQRWVLLEGTPVTSMICNTDLCNRAVNNPSTKLILFLSAVLSVFLYKFVLY